MICNCFKLNVKQYKTDDMGMFILILFNVEMTI